MVVVSPMRPTTVSLLPRLTLVEKPLDSSHETKWSSWSWVALCLTTAIIKAPPSR